MKRSSITLRQRTLPSGRTTLYLDIVCNGRRKFESLKLFLVPEASRADKQKNKETLKLAEAIRAKRVVEVQNNEFGFKSDYADETNFYDYFAAITEKRLSTESHGNWDSWRSCLRHLEKYDPNLKKRTFADITQEWVQGFHDYLENDAVIHPHGRAQRTNPRKLARNSRLTYYNKLRACLNKAYEEGILRINPMRGIESIRAEDSTRMYLTIDEVRALARTEADYPQVKAAFLFSCLTGLRRGDITRLTWGDVHQQGNFVRIVFRQKKTGGQEYLDIAPEAVELMGERKADDDLVFSRLPSCDTINRSIEVWCARAGITTKHITFHCGRHTFATMMLDLGTDIYTVSKLLGHRHIATTQIYAKVMDKNKQAAVSKIPDILSGTFTTK